VANSRLNIDPINGPTLYIDDGNVYEPKDAGVDSEPLVYTANGSEDVFTLANKPIAKAYLKTLHPAPYKLTDGSALAIRVGGKYYSHSFVPSDFEDITNATAYEVVASVNSNPAIGFNARTTDNGTKICFFAREETNDDIELATPNSLDAGSLLSLPSGIRYTLYLYKNDDILYKDGLVAEIATTPQSTWGAIISGDTLILNVDGTGYRTYTIDNADFVAADTGYFTADTNASLEAWAKVLNAKVAGVTTTVDGATLHLRSNKGASSGASLQISPLSTLVSKNLFSPDSLSVTGKNNDYVLDPNRGIIRLAQKLTAGDRLSVGTIYTRGYVESSALTTITPVSDALLWFVIDGNVQHIPHGLSGNVDLTLLPRAAVTLPIQLKATVNGSIVPAYPFTNVQAGDWLIMTADLYNTLPATGAYRISSVDPQGSWIETDRKSTRLNSSHNRSL
jgi:hypothetical protein